MKTITTVAFMGIAVAITAGVIGVNSLAEADNDIPKLSSTGMGILGHATFVVHDQEGNIKAYKQTDNAIITTGKDCVSRFLFHNTTAETDIACNDSELPTGFDGFRYIAIDNTTVVSGTLDSSASLGSEFTNEMTAWTRVGATPTFTPADGTSGTQVSLTSGSVSIGDSIGSTNVTRSALMADQAVGGTEAAAAIINIPDGVSVSSGDSLTVSWTVTVG